MIWTNFTSLLLLFVWRRSRWCSGRRLQSGLLWGRRGQFLMGWPGSPVSARTRRSIYCLGRLVISRGQSWHRASLPHPSAGRRTFTPAALLLSLCLFIFQREGSNTFLTRSSWEEQQWNVGNKESTLWFLICR